MKLSSSSSVEEHSPVQVNSDKKLIENWNIITDSSDIKEALTRNNDWNTNAYESSLTLYDKIQTYCQENPSSALSSKLLSSIECLEGAYRLYNPESIIGSFNGGKDAVVILHLLRAVHASHNSNLKMKRPICIYFENKLEFPEIRQFVHDATNEFNLHMIAFDTSYSFVEGLREFIDVQNNSQLGFVLGTRSNDPNSKSQGFFAPSSSYMPPFMRINPIIDWNYEQVWQFLREFNLNYCSLYDEGYTSLGNIEDTVPNPFLKVEGKQGYYPAYRLTDWSQERAGRLSKKKNKPQTETKCLSDVSSSVEQKESMQEGRGTSSVSTSSTLSEDTQQEPRQQDSSSSQPRLGGSLPPQPSFSFDIDQSAFQTKSKSSSVLTVGLLIIGNEIIKGQISDVNTYSAALAIRSNPNLKLIRVVIVSDEFDTIVDEIKSLLDIVDIIVTSGGIGPTHDDITIKSVAEALGEKLTIHEEMMNLLQSRLGNNTQNLTEAQIKMATLPENCQLQYAIATSAEETNDDASSSSTKKKQQWPILQVKNIFILPGVPKFFSEKISTIASYIDTKSYNKRSCSFSFLSPQDLTKAQRGTFKVLLNVDEHIIVSPLNTVVERHPNVIFGSYPYFDTTKDFKTIITLEGMTHTSFTKLKENETSNSSDYSSNSSIEQITTTLKFTEQEIETHLKLALADFLMEVPSESVVRVENNDDMKNL